MLTPLHPLFGLHADERGAGHDQRELALLDEPEIGPADFELRLDYGESSEPRTRNP